MIAALFEIHHDVQQWHLRWTATRVQRFKVSRQNVLIILPVNHTQHIDIQWQPVPLRSQVTIAKQLVYFTATKHCFMPEW